MRKKPVLIILILVGLCLAASDAEKPTAQTQPGEKQLADARAIFRWLLDPPINSTEKQHIEKLVGDMGADIWKVRENASKELPCLWPRVMPWIRQAAKSENLEVSIRAKRILKTLQVRVDNVESELNRAIDTLVAAGDKRLVSMLIQLLDSTNISSRYIAEYGLRRVTGKCFMYNAYAEPPERAKAVRQWQQWWKENRGGFVFKKQQPVGILICNDQRKRLTAVTPAGKVAWSRTFPQRVFCATGLANGNVIVGCEGKQVSAEEYDRDFMPVWNNNVGGQAYDVRRLSSGNTLIAYTTSNYVSEVSRTGKIVWEMKDLKGPISAERLGNGNTLIAELHRGRVIELSRDGKIVWEKTHLAKPHDATRLPSGNVLIAEYDSKRVVEVNRAGKMVWQFKCPHFPTSICRLPDGTTAIRSSIRGVILVRRDGKTIRRLMRDRGIIGKIRLVPAAVLQKQSAISSQPSAKPKK